MFYSSRPALTLALACTLMLAGCDTPANGMKAKKDPVSLQKPSEAAPVNPPLPMDGDKITRLEQQIAALEKEVAANRPKIAKIDIMEQKFKDLSLGLDRIDATYDMQPTQAAPVVAAKSAVLAPVVKPMSPPVAVVPPKPPEKMAEKPAAKPPAPERKAEAPKPAAVGKKTVNDLRIGEKKEYSRLVLDMGQSVKVNYDIDNDEKILLIDIPGFTWVAAKTKTFPKSLLIASYQASTDESGAHLVVQLKGPAKVANYSNIEATGGKSPRAVLDIAPQ